MASKKNIIVSLTIGALSFVVYMATAYPSISTGDSGEIATVVYSWGIAHPTGFPTYIISARLFSYLLPFLEFAYRLNIFSALAGAATVGIVFLVMRKLNIGIAAGAGAALSLAFGYTFWTHSGSIQVYGLTAFFFSLAVLLLLRYFETKRNANLYLLAIVSGLGAGAHLTFLLFFPFAFIIFITMRRKIKSIPPAPRLLPSPVVNPQVLLLGSLVSFAVILTAIYSYIPLRASQSPELNWGDPSTKGKFINYITQRDYAGKIGTRGAESWELMLRETGRLFSREFTWFALAFIIFGAAIAFKKQRPFFYSGLALIALNVLLLGNYGNSRDIVVLWRYFLPSYIVMAIFLSFALDGPWRWGSLPVLARASIAALLPLIIFSFHLNSLNRRNDFLAPKTIQNIFSAVPQGGILITSGDTITGAAMFEQIVSGKRKDLLIIDDRLYTHPWYKEKKKKEMEAKNIKFADNLPFLIKENKDKEIYSISNSISFLTANYNFYPFGIAYKIVDKGAVADTRVLKEKNDALWQNYAAGLLKNKNFDTEYFSKETVGLYLSALNNLAAHLANHNYVDAAIDYFEKSLEIRENKNALYNLAGIYGALGDRQKAAEYNSRLAAFQ